MLYYIIKIIKILYVKYMHNNGKNAGRDNKDEENKMRYTEMKSRNNNVLKLPVLIVYVIVFYSIWTIWEFWGKSFINNAFGNEYISQLIKSGVIKNLVWTVPAILLVNHFKADLFVGLKDMFKVKPQFLKYLPIFLFLPFICLLASFWEKVKYRLVKSLNSAI